MQFHFTSRHVSFLFVYCLTVLPAIAVLGCFNREEEFRKKINKDYVVILFFKPAYRKSPWLFFKSVKNTPLKLKGCFG